MLETKLQAFVSMKFMLRNFVYKRYEYIVKGPCSVDTYLLNQVA